MNMNIRNDAPVFDLGNGTARRNGMRIARIVSIVMCALLVVAGVLHQYTVGFDTDRTLMYISIIFAAIHVVIFGTKLGRKEP